MRMVTGRWTAVNERGPRHPLSDVHVAYVATSPQFDTLAKYLGSLIRAPLRKVLLMAKETRIEWIDDLDGKPVEAEDCHTVELEVKLPGRRTTRYELDMRTANVARFEKDLSKYLDKATPVRVGQSTGRATNGSAGTAERSRVIREWAIDNGYEVSARGRIPHDIIEAFDADH
jgi:hypothetical protein